MKKTNDKKRIKISTKQVKLSDQEPGFTFGGTFKGFTEGQPFQVLDDKTGEIVTKSLKSAIFEEDTGDRVAYLCDRGLEGAIRDSMVKEGDALEIVKLPKQKLSKGRTMNSYDIFQLV